MRRKQDWSAVVLTVGTAFLVCAFHDEIRRTRGELDKCILPAIVAGIRAMLLGGDPS